MKTSHFLLPILSAVLMVSCVKESVSSDEPVAPSNTVLKLGFEDFKTYIGEPDAQGARKVFWSAGDCLVCCPDGIVSEPVSEEYVGRQSAEFVFPGILTEPFNLLYPACRLVGSTGSTVELPAVQDYSKGTFATNTAVAVGKLSSGKSAMLKGVQSIVKLSIAKGSHSDPLRNVFFSGGNGEQVSGKFTVADFATGELTPQGTAGKDDLKTRVFLNDKSLTEESLDLFVLVPAGTYSKGFKIRVIDSQNHFQDVFKKSSIELKANTVHLMPEFAFAPTGTVVAAENPDCAGTPDLTVSNADEYLAFANAFNAGDYAKYGSCNVKVTADLDFDSKTFVTIGTAENKFSGNFDFCGHSVKNITSVDRPMFDIVENAFVSNLTVDGSCSFTSSKNSARQNWAVVVAKSTMGSTISNVHVACDNNVSMVNGASNIRSYGTVVGVLTGGSTIVNCSADGKFIYSNDGQKTAATTLFAPIAAWVDDALSSVENCNTTGNVIFNEPSVKPVTASTTPYFYVGGLIGKNSGSISKCGMSGNITYSDYPANLLFGGIVGSQCGPMSNCEMTGNISVDQSKGNTTDNPRSYIGGLAGRFSGSLLNSNNKGKTLAFNCVINDLCVGGLIGKLMQDNSQQVNVSDCINEAVITQTGTGGKVGGIVGHTSGSASATNIVENCKNQANITGAPDHLGGIVAYQESYTQVRYCENAASTVLTTSKVDGRAGGICSYLGNANMDYCTNYGRVVNSGASGITGGVVGIFYNDNAILTDSSNYGDVVAVSGTSHGLLTGMFSKLSKCDGCFVSGKCFDYVAGGNHVQHTVTKDNWLTVHTGANYSSVASKVTNITSSYGGGSSTVDLKDAELRILFIGNSFTDDAAKQLPGLINAAGLSKKITIAQMYFGGRIMSEYNNWSKADYTLYKYEAGVNTNAWTTHSDKVSIQQVAQNGRWDIITMQEHTGNYHAWVWDDPEKSYFDGMFSKLKALQPKAKFYYIFSQAYYDMNKIGAGSRSYMTWPLDTETSSRLKMYSVMLDWLNKMLAVEPFDGLIASGTYLENLRTSSANTSHFSTRDGYHMDNGTARWGVAALVFESLISPKFGVLLDNNKYRISQSSTVEPYCTPVTDKNAPILLQAARYAIQNPYKITDMSGDTPKCELEGSGTSADPYLIKKNVDMAQITNGLKGDAKVYFKQMADIDMSSYSSWYPCSDDNKKIDYDGQGYTISNLKSSVGNASLFGAIAASSVRNINFDNCTISCGGTCGVVASAMQTSSTLENITVTNSSVSNTSTSSGNIGGLVGQFNGTVTKCSFSGTMNTAINGTYKDFTGGIVGRASATTTIQQCWTDLTVNGPTSGTFCGQVGGILGATPKDVKVTIKNCWTKGTGTRISYAGGIAGEISKGSTVENCYSLMNISGSYAIGGIVGRAANYVNPNSTGTYHDDLQMTVRKCIAWNGSLTSTNYSSPSGGYSSGAVVGFNIFKNTLADCYRKPDMTFQMYDPASLPSYNTLVDQNNSGPSSEYVQMGNKETYYMPYHGKAAASGKTVTQIAIDLGWDSSVWSLTGSVPTLK